MDTGRSELFYCKQIRIQIAYIFYNLKKIGKTLKNIFCQHKYFLKPQKKIETEIIF